MALRSFFVFVPVPREGKLEFGECQGTLYTQQDLWRVAQSSFRPCLIFRVRSEKDPGEISDVKDRLESCVGLVDVATRWRCVFNMTKTMIATLQHPVIKSACWDVMRFVSTSHPASVTPDQRKAIVDGISKAAGEQMEGTESPQDFEKLIAFNVAALAQADNDLEAAQYVPFWRALCPFDPKSGNEEAKARIATIETMSGAVLLAEAANRLSERMPMWHFAEMPKAEAAQPAGDDEGDDE
jgi:hypothetical protein